MKNITLLITACFSLFLMSLSSTVQASESIDAAVNEVFGSATGWFVSLIFAPIPGTTFP